VQAASVALAGDSVDVTVSGVEPHAAWQGSILCHPDFPVRCATTFEARVLVLEVPIPILKGHSVTLHAHTAREEAVVSSLVALVDPKTGAVTKQRPRCLMKGQVRRAAMTT
jgi:elongation factor 1 alpha-like protein